jgi:phosphopantetheine adenylyltransferase
MLKSKSHAELLEPFESRTEHLQTFLRHLSANIQYDIVALRDTYGPTATDGEISALIVSRESAAGGLASKLDHHCAAYEETGSYLYCS